MPKLKLTLLRKSANRNFSNERRRNCHACPGTEESYPVQFLRSVWGRDVLHETLQRFYTNMILGKWKRDTECEGCTVYDAEQEMVRHGAVFGEMEL